MTMTSLRFDHGETIDMLRDSVAAFAAAEIARAPPISTPETCSRATCGRSSATLGSTA